MTDLRPVLRILGVLLLMFGCTMAVPAAASLAFDDGIFSVYPRAIGLAWICGLLLWWSARAEVERGEVVTTLRDWRLSIFGNNMYLLWMPNRHQTKAVRTMIDFLLERAEVERPA